MKVLIIGGVAAGTKVAAKLKRENRDLDVTILTEGTDISYAGCGLPYYVGNLIKDRDELIVNTPESFEGLTGVEVLTNHRAVSVDPDKKEVRVLDLNSENSEKIHNYDKLVIATGASPIKPPIEGIDLDGVYFMRTPKDAIELRDRIEKLSPRRATVIGGGFIGLEVAENLKEQGMVTTVIDMASSIPPGFEKEMTDYIIEHLADQGIMVFTETRMEAILGEEGKVTAIKTDKHKMKTDLVVLSLGVRANTNFLEDSNIELMPNGTIKVNEYLETNLKDIYAVGDCATVTNRLTSEPAWSPMGSTANIAGRILAQNIEESKVKYKGALSTAVAQLPGLNIGRTGLTEYAAKNAGYDPISVITVTEDKAHYFPGSSLFIIKMIADRESQKLLGLQVLGLDNTAVDKIVDIAVTSISLGASLEDIMDLDLSYAPPFSTAINPIAHTVNILINKIKGEYETMTAREFSEGKAKDYKIIDVAVVPELVDYPFLDLSKVDGPIDGLKKDDKILLVCSKGKRAYMMQNKLKHLGYTNTKALEGGSIVNNI